MFHDLNTFTIHLTNLHLTNTTLKGYENINNNYFKDICITNAFYPVNLSICLINIDNDFAINDFYIKDSLGMLQYAVTPERKYLLQKLLQVKDQEVNNALLLHKIRCEIVDVYQKSSKTYKFYWCDIDKLAYLNLESYFAQTMHKCHSDTEILVQTANLESGNKEFDNIEIEKSFNTHQLKSKRRRKSLPQRFSFNIKSSVNLAKQDNRRPLELFESIIKKLHKTYRYDEVELLCSSCDHDITIPQVTKNSVFLGNNFIKSLLKKFKRSPEISYGNPDKVTKILQELGYNHTEIYNVLNSDDDNASNVNFNDHQTQSPHAQLPSQNVYKHSKSVRLNSKRNRSDTHQFDQTSGGQKGLSGKSKPEILGQNATVKLSDNVTVFNILDSLSKCEISYKNRNVFKILSSFIGKHSNFFMEHDPTSYEKFLKNSKRYFKVGIYSLNKRARKLIKNIFFSKINGKSFILKDHLIKFFKEKKLFFTDAPSNFKDILLQQAISRNGTIPYLTLKMGTKDVQFTVDSGCSHNLLTNASYRSIRHLETSSYNATNISLRTIDDTVSNNVINRVSFIPIVIKGKTYLIKFYVGDKFNRNFLGSNFLVETQANVIFQKDKGCHVLVINDEIFPLDFLYLKEVIGNNAILNPLSPDCKAKPEDLIKNSISFKQTAFDIFGTEADLDNRITEILDYFDCIPTDEITGSAGNLDYDTLDDSEIYPSSEMNDFLEKRIYLPTFNENEKDPFYFENSHLTQEQSLFLKNIIKDHESAISTPQSPLGDFKLFQISINFFPGKTAHQVKRNIDFDMVNQDINRMIRLGIISENVSTEIPSLSNLVIVSKASRLCKADRFNEKQQKKLDKSPQNPQKTENQNLGSSKNPEFRLTVDLSDVNAILWGNKYINLAKYESILENLTDCYLSKLDLAEYFFCFNLDQNSRSKINFYFKNKIYSFNRMPQGISIAPYYSVLGTALSFSLEGLKLFLKTFPEYKDEQIFKVNDITKLVLFYIDDSLIYSKKNLGWRAHFLVIKYVLWTFALVGLKVKLEKCQFLVFETKFLGLFLNTQENCHFIPEKRLSAMELWPRPQSCGELNSRLSCLNFYSKYLPFFKPIAFPLLQLAKSEKFIWTDLEERAWSELKFLLKFSLKLHFVQPQDRLLIFTDSSCLSAGYVLVKCDSNLHFYPILAENRLFVKAEKRQSIVFKEALSLLFALERCEKYVKANHNKVLLFTDAISLSQVNKLKNSSSKLYELSLLLTAYPNLQVTFLRGKYNSMADLISRKIFNAIVSDDIVDPDILSISHDVSQLVNENVVSLSHESLQEYLLNNNSSKYIDLLKTKRIFHIKKEYLRESSPYNTASERELLFLLLNSSKFDLQHLNLNILKDYLMSLNKTKISKNVLQDFIKYTMSKVSRECLNQLFPMSKTQINDFLAEAKNNNCPEFLRSDCKDLVHPLQNQIKDLYLTKGHNWSYKNKAKNKDKNIVVDSPAEDQPSCEVNVAVCTSSPYNKKDIDKFLFSEQCDFCQLAGSNVNCKFKSEHNSNLLSTIQELYSTMDKLLDKNLNFSTHNLVHFQEIFSNLCLKPNNITKLMMILYFGHISVIENFYKLEHQLSSISHLSPIFYNCAPQIKLEVNSQSVNETVIEVYLTECLTVKEYSELDLVINLNLLLNTDCYLQSCQIGSVICLAPNIERYPNLLFLQQIQLVNFEESPTIVDITQPILSLHIYYPEKEFQLIQVDKICFEGLFSNLIGTQQLNSLQYLSGILSKQLLNMNEFRTQSDLKSKLIECNSALLNNKKEDLLEIYEKNFKEIDDLGHLFNLLFNSKSNFDKKSFILAQKINFPKLFSKAENKTSLKFVLDDGVLKCNTKDKLKTALPGQLVESTFIALHLKGLHNLDSLIKNKLFANFYIPIKTMNQAIKKAIKSCLNCNILTPKSQKKFIGLKRNLNEFLASGKHFFIDIAYLKTGNATHYLLLVCDQASSYLICKLFDCISVKLVTDFMLTIFSIISLTNCIISDSGSENSQLLTDSLLALGIRHKRISPGASSQNNAESSIRLFRHSLKKIINNSSQNGLKIDFGVLNKLCLIACNLVNECPPYNSFFSRKEMFMGLHFFNKGHNMSRYVSESSLLENVDNIILFKDIQKFYTHRIRVLNHQGLKANKKVPGIYLKRGDFVINKFAKTKQLLYDPQKTYYCVLRVENPRCRVCIDNIDLCAKCNLLPTSDVSLVHLATGNKTRRSVNQISHVQLNEILDPTFFLKLQDLSRDLPDFIKEKIGTVNSSTVDDPPSNHYNLRPRGQNVEANFGLVKRNNKYFFNNVKCKIQKNTCKNLSTSSIGSSILKKNPQVLSHSELWESWSTILSSDQLVFVIRALHLHLDLQIDYQTIFKNNSDIKQNHYLKTLLRNFFQSYKRGEVSLALTNQLKLAELCPKQGKRVKSISFNPTISICLIDENKSICRKLRCNSLQCDPINCTKSLCNDITYVEQKLCLLCVSGKESHLLSS